MSKNVWHLYRTCAFDIEFSLKKSLHMCLVMADGLWKDEWFSPCWSFCFHKIDSFTCFLECCEASFDNTGQTFKNGLWFLGVLLYTVSQKNWVLADSRASMESYGCPTWPSVLCRATWNRMFVRKFYKAGKKEQNKDAVWGHVSVSGLNMQERKAFCRATSWEMVLFANSSLVLKGLTFVNIFARYQ